MKPSFSQTNNPKRQKLIKGVSGEPGGNKLLKAGMLLASDIPVPQINTLPKLRDALQTAVELEHSTIPTYLCALYSIKDGTNAESSAIIRSVVVEEMLHMLLAANILNAIGGKPAINVPHFIPTYPTYLPGSDDAFLVNLAKFSKENVEVFLKIEKPAHHTMDPKAKGYATIGEFYAAVTDGIKYVNAHTKGGIFVKDKEWQKRQITAEHYYGSGGVAIPVYKLEDALLAIEEIVGQGEGIDDTINDSDEKIFGQGLEYAHYFRFNELYEERLYTEKDTPKSGPTGPALPVDWDAVYSMKMNPKIEDYKGQPELLEKARAFNQTYTALLDNIHHACNGQPELLMKGIGLMYQLKYKAIELMNIPYKDGLMAGPTFEFDKG